MRSVLNKEMDPCTDYEKTIRMSRLIGQLHTEKDQTRTTN